MRPCSAADDQIRRVLQVRAPQAIDHGEHDPAFELPADRFAEVRDSPIVGALRVGAQRGFEHVARQQAGIKAVLRSDLLDSQLDRIQNSEGDPKPLKALTARRRALHVKTDHFIKGRTPPVVQAHAVEKGPSEPVGFLALLAILVTTVTARRSASERCRIAAVNSLTAPTASRPRLSAVDSTPSRSDAPRRQPGIFPLSSARRPVPGASAPRSGLRIGATNPRWPETASRRWSITSETGHWQVVGDRCRRGPARVLR